MSANAPLAVYPYSWIQPVSFDPDAYRGFAKSLDEQLLRLENNHPKRVPACHRNLVETSGQTCGAASADDLSEPTEN